MPTLNPKITAAGQALFPQPALPGFNVVLTHVALGTGVYNPTGAEVALQAEVARFPITSGGTPSPTQVRIGAKITNQDPQGHVTSGMWVGEIGFYAGSTLFAVWSRASGALFCKTADFDVALAYTLDVSILPASSVTVNVNADLIGMGSMILDHQGDPNAHPQLMGMITGHISAADPHPIYLTKAEADAFYDSIGLAADAINQDAARLSVHVAAADPHPQYMTQAEVESRFRADRAKRYYHTSF